MRLGLLTAARQSLNRAKSLLSGVPSDSLEENFSALEETAVIAASRNHDPNEVYEQYSLLQKPTRGNNNNNDETNLETDFVVDLSKSLGVGLKEDLVVDNVKVNGQFHTAGVEAGDVIVAAGVSSVSTLEQFKEVISASKTEGVVKLVITFKRVQSREEKEEGTIGDVSSKKRSSAQGSPMQLKGRRPRKNQGVEGHCSDGNNAAVRGSCYQSQSGT